MAKVPGLEINIHMSDDWLDAVSRAIASMQNVIEVNGVLQVNRRYLKK